MKITRAQARAELERRAMPKPRPAAATPEVFRATGAELRKVAGKTSAPKSTAKLTSVRKADPAKQAAARVADKAGPAGTTAWWLAYRGERARQRAAA